MRSRAPSALALALALASASCGDSAGPEDYSGPDLRGSYNAREAVLLNGNELVGAGHLVGYRFTATEPPIFRIVQLPPASLFAEPVVIEGFFQYGERTQIVLLSRTGTPIDVATATAQGSAITLDHAGNLGMDRAVLDPSTGPAPSQLSGTWSALSLTAREQDGTSKQLASAGNAIELQFGSLTNSYGLSGRAPAGTLADSAVSLNVTQGVFDTVGLTLILGGAFNCAVFVASVTIAERLRFQGIACNLAGKRWLLEAEFART